MNCASVPVGEKEGAPQGASNALWRTGRAAWPAIDLSEADFAAYAVPLGADVPLERAGDLYLVCASALGRPRALESLESLLVAVVRRAVARLDPSTSFRDLVAQEMRTRLLLGDRPKILDYAGRASLATWLKTTAVRTALNLRRARGDQSHDSVSSNLGVDGALEPRLLRERYRPRFEEAVRAAVAALTDRERALLRANVGEGQSVDRLAATYGVSRATAARWLAAARQRLSEETRRRLRAELGLTSSELESLAAVVAEDLDVSVVRLLGA